MAEKDKWDVVPMFKAECSPAALYTGSTNAANRAECHAWYQWALRTIARLHPNTVFISFLSADSGVNQPKDERGIASLLDQEKKDAQHVVLMLDTPYLADFRRPLDCLHESGATLRTCTGIPLYSNQALGVLARHHHVGVIDPLGWFCYKFLCPLAIGHTIAFADYGFVSGVYATALAPPFRAAFRAALRAR